MKPFLVAPLRIAIAAMLLAAVMLTPASRAAEPSAVVSAPARVLLIRGVFNVFSTGMDDLGRLLREHGYEVEVSSPGGAWAAAMRLREAYERDPHGGPLVIMGHSMGGRGCLHISRYLEAYNIPVRLVVVIDANPWVSVPANVERCVNLYVTNPFGVFHGSPVYGGASSRIYNIDVTKVARPTWAEPVNHFNIDNSPWMHQVILEEMARAYAPWRAHQGASPQFRPPRHAGDAAVGDQPKTVIRIRL